MINPETNDFYIGSRKSKVPPLEDPYRESSKTWYNTLSTHIIQNVLIKEILEDGINSQKDLNERENKWILENIKDPLCKNSYIPAIGFYCKEVKKETREKISCSLKGYKHNDEARKNNSIAQSGKILSEDHKIKISSSMKKNMTEEKRKNMSENQKGKEPWNKGKELSESHKQNISSSIKKGMTDEIKKKISEAGKGREPWNKGKKTIRRTKKQIEEDRLKNQKNA